MNIFSFVSRPNDGMINNNQLMIKMKIIPIYLYFVFIESFAVIQDFNIVVFYTLFKIQNIKYQTIS